MHEKEIEVKIRMLPEYLMRELLDHIEFLLSKYDITKTEKKKFGFDWEGGLSEIRKSSVRLSCNTRLWNCDDVFGGYEHISGNSPDTG